MTKYIFITFSLLVVMLSGCHEKTSKSDSKLFADYLNTTFGQIPHKGDSVKYILVSDHCCHSCIEGVLANLPAKKNCVIILGKDNALKYKEYVVNGSNILVDSTGNVSRIKFCKDNVAFVDVVNSEISEIAAPEPRDILGFISRTCK